MQYTIMQEEFRQSMGPGQHIHLLWSAGVSAPKKVEREMVVPLSRANNVSIMLTQFSQFKAGPAGIRRAVVTGKGLSLERLSLLLQVSPRMNC